MVLTCFKWLYHLPSAAFRPSFAMSKAFLNFCASEKETMIYYYIARCYIWMANMKVSTFRKKKFIVNAVTMGPYIKSAMADSS